METEYENLSLRVYYDKPIADGICLFHRVEVIEYVENLAPYHHRPEQRTWYEIHYMVKRILSKNPLVLLLRVYHVGRVTPYIDYEPDYLFSTTKGEGLFPNGILATNLPKVHDEIVVRELPKRETLSISFARVIDVEGLMNQINQDKLKQ